MGRLRRKRTHNNNKEIKRAVKTKHYKRDIDQIHGDMKPGNKSKLESQPVDLDLPGLGQFYCVPCCRHFITKDTFEKHARTKAHKKRLKILKEEPYTQKDADLAGGMGAPDNGPQTVPAEMVVM